MFAPLLANGHPISHPLLGAAGEFTAPLFAEYLWKTGQHCAIYNMPATRRCKCSMFCGISGVAQIGVEKCGTAMVNSCWGRHSK